LNFRPADRRPGHQDLLETGPIRLGICAGSHVLISLSGSVGALSLHHVGKPERQRPPIKAWHAMDRLDAARIDADVTTPRPPILLVEDTPSLQMVYRSILAAAGYRVVVAGTAAEGLAAFRTHAPHWSCCWTWCCPTATA
jgi:hypothetical protein